MRCGAMPAIRWLMPMRTDDTTCRNLGTPCCSVTQVEIQVIGSRRDTVSTYEDIYRQQTAIDAIKGRFDQIERRLEPAN